MTWSFETAVRTLWQESRGEPQDGRRAVAHVLWNRLRTGKWGHTFAEVCLYPLAFSGWNVRDPNREAVAKVPDDDPVMSELRTILTAAENEPDPTRGACFYYNPEIVTPAWAADMVDCGTFGHQRFMKEKGQ